MPIDILVNGEPQTIPAGQTILGLLEQLHLEPSRVAIELNRRIVRQPAWAQTELPAGAELEIVQFVGGG